jgi:AbiV family abortive infection protein
VEADAVAGGAARAALESVESPDGLSVTPVGLDFILRGGWFALEQAGRLLTDAKALYRAGSYSGAVALALFSREEVAKSRKLFALWMRAARGENITFDQLVEEIDMPHVEKQKHGASMFSLRTDEATLDLLRSGRDVSPAEYDEVIRRSRFSFERLLKTAPHTRHKDRLRALYVDPAPDQATWSRPSDFTSREARDILTDAGNDYWQQHSSPGLPALASDMDKLNAALAAWTDKPTLPSAEVG